MKTYFKKFILQEILFLRFQKPSIVSKLIYYNAIYKIEAKNAVWWEAD